MPASVCACPPRNSACGWKSGNPEAIIFQVPCGIIRLLKPPRYRSTMSERHRPTRPSPDRGNGAQQPRGRWLFVILPSLVIAVAGIVMWNSFGRSAARRDPRTPVIDADNHDSADVPPVTDVGKRQPPGPVPVGMVWVPSGKFIMGGEAVFADAQPNHVVDVDGFWLDRSEVTNAQFARFVRATGYVTVAEQTPKAEDYPGAPPESLVPGSIVFRPPDEPADLTAFTQWWFYH